MSTHHGPPLLLALLAVSTMACRLGGPSAYEQPPLDVEWPPDTGGASDETSTDTASVDDTTIDEIGTDARGETDGAPESGAEAETDVGADAPLEVGCTAGTPAVCDPLENTGCAAGSRCTTSSTANTGRCVYLGAVGAGGFCTATDGAIGFLGTDTCASKLACLSNKCVALCWCDGDCASGSCCNVPFGTTGFKGCGSCH